MQLRHACTPGSSRGSPLSFISRQQPRAFGLHSRQRHNHRLKPCPPQAIGFDLPGSTPAKPVERQAEDLSRAASSLLLYRNVLKSGPAVDFSSIVFNLQKGSPLTLMESYGSFYRGLVSEDVVSWQDYLLDQVLRGVDNPFARAASKLERTDYLLPAVRNDLNVFQTLAVTETTLATWCKDVAYNVSEEWRAAASSMKQHATGAEDEAARGGKQEDSLGDWSVESLLNNPTPPHVLAPLNKAQRAALRSAIASKWQWSEAAELLNKYYAAHDFGIISMHSVLKWTGDRMQAQDVLDGVTGIAMENIPEMPDTNNVNLEGFLKAFFTGDLSDRSNGYDSVLAEGQDEIIAYMAIVNTLDSLIDDFYNSQRTALGLAAMAARIVLLPLDKASTLPDLAWTMSQHPRVRFIVVCPGLEHKKLYSMSSMPIVFDGYSWPANAFFMSCTGLK